MHYYAWIPNPLKFGSPSASAIIPNGLQQRIKQEHSQLSRAGRCQGHRRSPTAVGKLLPNVLYVHRSALEALDPLLRIYGGCARAYLGEIDGANLIKLRRHSGKVSYLVRPDFGTDPHPTLLRSVKLSLRSREINCLEHAASAKPLILHRKETFMSSDHPLHAKFTRLSEQEEKHGLLDGSAMIGMREGWQAPLSAAGFTLRGHRLVRR